MIGKYEIHPEDFGLPMIASRNLKVANAAKSLNAGTALYAAGVASSIEDGLNRAGLEATSGAALRKIDQFVQVTQNLGG